MSKILSLDSSASFVYYFRKNVVTYIILYVRLHIYLFFINLMNTLSVKKLVILATIAVTAGCTRFDFQAPKDDQDTNLKPSSEYLTSRLHKW